MKLMLLKIGRYRDICTNSDKFFHHIFIYCKKGKRKGKAIHVTGCGGPYGCETSRLPHLLDNRLTDGGDVVSLTRRPPFTSPGRFLVLIFVRGWVDPRAILRLEGLGQLKKSNDLSLSFSLSLYIYIYRERERERERVTF
jgi:hypothetical protein